ncbi:lysophospholipase [Parathielavia appendiculata]|uniref:Lysophospholipase n=1 Tax=Parathielavia appendiculata TaxID=2587402 RepID=A0AAN6Z244_9PEZI|nr:lysophospholipase [Parathielavia appendiculata]
MDLVLMVMFAALTGCSTSFQRGDELSAHDRRGKADAPKSYSPAHVPCPEMRPYIRPADGLSFQEAAWLGRRGNATMPALVDVLERAAITGLDIRVYLQSLLDSGLGLPRIGIAVSGGGYRALMNGAGAISAFDNRTSGSTAPGRLGGVLQAATYLSGLSGGSWLVGSIYTQNFTTVDSIIHANGGFLSELWEFNESIIEGPATLSVGDYYRELLDTVNDKFDAGYNTTITDYWGRSLSYQLVNATDGGPGYTYSSIANDTAFMEASIPMPIIVALERPSGQLLIWENSTVFEFNLWEMGSYDPGNPAFAPLRYVGSRFTNGSLSADSECIAGVDNVGFVMGTSSSLFNQALLQLARTEGAPDLLVRSLNATLSRIGEENRDVANWPNPFFQHNIKNNRNANSSVLSLVDGGEDLQNIPLHPLLWSHRHVDVILAVDSSADTPTHWPNGTALVATYERTVANYSEHNAAAFPSIPNQNTFVNLGLNSRPTFFGCDPVNMTGPGPLVVYLPNAPYTYYSNVSTFDMEYTTEERQNIIYNGYNVVTMANASVDAQWPACLACAILSRSFHRTKSGFPAVCVDCFNRYCWNGTVNSTTPAAYDPGRIVKSSGAHSRTAFSILFYVVIVWLFSA